MTVGSIYALVAIGFTIIYNCTQVVNFAQGEFVMLGAMVAAILVATGHVSLPIACLIAVAVTSIIGCTVGATLLRPLRTGSTITLIIITVGASILIRGIMMLRSDKDAIPLRAFSADNTGADRVFSLGGAFIGAQTLWVLAATILLVVLLWLFYRYTMVGRAMRACASCKPGAKIVGININRMTMLSFALGSAVGAVAGVIIAPISSAQYDMGTMLGLKGFCAAILGGLGNFTGGIVAGLLLGVLEALGAGYVSSSYKDAIAFVILLAVLFSRPQGIFGGKKSG